MFWTQSILITRFLLVPKGKYMDSIVCWFVTIQGNIARVAEVDEKFAPSGHFGKRSADGWRRFQQLEMPSNRLSGSLRRFWTLANQERSAALQS